MKLVEFAPIQKQVYVESTHRWNILSGATRSGKTTITFYKIPKRIKAHRSENIFFFGKTVATLNRNVLEELRKIYGKRISKIYNKEYCYMWGKKVYCIGANDISCVTKIQGISIGYAYCDEIATYPEELFQMLKSRLDKPNACCDATCNPASPSHFIKQFIDDEDVDCYNKHFAIYDNPFLPPEFVRNLENEYKGTIYYDRYILGNWVKSEGLVYPLFKREKNLLTEEEYANKFGMHRVQMIIFGGDGATTNDATAIVPIFIMDNGQAVVPTGDLFYHNPKENGQLSNAQLVEPIQRWLERIDRKYNFQGVMKYYMAIDCAAADLVLTLKYRLPQYMNVFGFTQKHVQQNTDTMNNCFSRNALILLQSNSYYNYIKNIEVDTSKCGNPLVVNLENTIWNKDNTRFARDSGETNDHSDCSDALKYGICSYYCNFNNLYSIRLPEPNKKY